MPDLDERAGRAQRGTSVEIEEDYTFGPQPKDRGLEVMWWSTTEWYTGDGPHLLYPPNRGRDRRR